MLARASLGKESSANAKTARASKAEAQPRSLEQEQSLEELTPPKFSWSFGEIQIEAPAINGPPVSGDDNPWVWLAGRRARSLPWPMQAKLEVGAADDPLEQEADRIAEKVMRCDMRKAEQNDYEHIGVQREPIAAHISSIGSSPSASEMTAPPIVHEVLRFQGQPLDTATRAFFEPRFGWNLGDVRIHSNELAASSARQIRASAYAFGNHIVIGDMQHAPDTPGGRQLMAHELAHVIQQQKFSAISGSRSQAAGRVRRFTEMGHKMIVDTAFYQAWSSGTLELVPGLQVSAGDAAAMGDYFRSFEQMRRYAKNPGTGPGTQGEVLYVLWVKIWHKPIGEKMNRWYDKNAVQVRDQAANSLDAENISHFPNPKSGDTSLTPLQKNQRVDTSGEPLGAAATYRTDHREAMRMAYEHGRKREKMEDALLADSFACHFLTDSFSAGHIRTPRASIKEYWNNLVPDFQEKLIHWLASAINREHWGLQRPGAYLKGGSVEEQSTLKLEILLSPREHLSFGNVASLIVHDVEGDQGVDATIGSQKISLVGDKGLLQGDKDDKFDTAASFQPTAQGQATFNAAVEAVKASFDDLWKAYDTGWKNQPLSSTDEMIRAKDGLYPAERLLPQPVPDSQLPKSKQSFSWQQKSVVDFLNTHKQGLVQWGQAEAVTFQKKLDEIKDLPPEAKNAIRRSLLAPLSSGKSQAIADVILNVIGQR